MKVRRSSRAIVLDARNRILLLKTDLSMLSDRKTVWVAPGGGLEAGEGFEDALRRELHEELGLDIEGFHEWVFYRNQPFTMASGEEFLSEERYYLVLTEGLNVHLGNATQLEKRIIKEWRWWAVDEIQDSTESFFAEDLAERLAVIIGGHLPEEPVEI